MTAVFLNYLRGVSSEARKTSWAGVSDVFSSSMVVVILASFVMTLVLCVDWFFVYFMTLLLGVK